MIKIKILKKPSPNDKVKNPITGRMIKRDGAIHKKLIKIKILEKPKTKIKKPKPKMVKIKILEKKKPKPKMVKIKVLKKDVEKKKEEKKKGHVMKTIVKKVQRVLSSDEESDGTWEAEKVIIPEKNIATEQDIIYATQNNFTKLKNKGALKVGQIVREDWDVNETDFFNYYKIKRINKITLVVQEIDVRASPYKVSDHDTEFEEWYYYINIKKPKLKTELTKITRHNVEASISKNFVVTTTRHGAHIDHPAYTMG